VRQAKQHDAQAFQLLRSVPGIGKVLALTILYEVHDVHRFDRVQEFASYARLVKCAKESAGKKLLAKLEKRFGKGKALSVLAHKLGRAVYFMLVRGKAFDAARFLATVN
jgi:transposase